MKRSLFVVAFLLAALSLPAAYSHFFPLPAFDQTLTAYPGQIPLVLGGRDGFSQGSSYHRRDYVLLPSFFLKPKLIKVTQVGDAPPEVTETNETVALSSFLTAILLGAVAYARKSRRRE
ncbi:hypothetical protein [Dyella mobilis]|uniref:PEP-CTERM protein-sorting domain-containing protein n=1 Tax=Dyella mobilis TaxID=1849582 RepID=A0ABS2KEI1_9GAMM|nr:hypothetical protein [Dyella mobilis]MBM7129576.1 hypothetical protein [Dyella mobilis]